MSPPTMGSAMTYQAAGSDHPTASGRSVQRASRSSLISEVKLAAMIATGMPIRAQMATRMT